MAQYPAAIPTFTSPTSTEKLGASTPPHASQHQLLNTELGAALAIIGINPQGTGSTLVARLDTADSLIATAATNSSIALSTATAAYTTATAGFALAGVATSQAAVALSTATAAYTVATIATSNAAVALSTATAALSTAQAAYSTAAAAIPKALGSSKGQLIVFSGSGLPAILGASADGLALVCDATSTGGFKFAAMSTGSGSGDVIGPATATVDAVAIYNSADGKSIKNSLVVISTTGSINIPAGEAYKVDGTALSAASVSAIAVPAGGTIGSLIIKTSDGSFVILAQSASGLGLISAGAAAIPVWGAVGGSGSGGASVVETPFASADLSSGIFTVTARQAIIGVKDATGSFVFPDISHSGTNTLINCTNMGVAASTWWAYGIVVTS